MNLQKRIYTLIVPIVSVLMLTACQSTKNLSPSTGSSQQIDSKKLSGGSSGMEQLTDSTYLVVYDLKMVCASDGLQSLMNPLR